MKKQLVIGAGTGRCGTTTLAKLLNMQPDSHVTHERFSHRFKWAAADKWQRKIIEGFNDHRSSGLYGDVALQHGCCLQHWLEIDAKVVIMKRDIDSYLRSWHKKAGKRNNWQPPREGGTPRANWYNCFPKFAGMANRDDALISYYNLYYRTIAPRVQQRYPDQVIVAHVSIFNTERGQRRLLDFLGVPHDQQVIKVGLKKNRLVT